MSTWSSRGLRGSQFENAINITNEKYREHGIALVQKIPTPIKPLEIDDDRHITLAYFEKRSTVDYIGIVQGYPLCFDAKECASDTFALDNVHEHQFNFMKDFVTQGGISFLLINFFKSDRTYYMRFSELETLYDSMTKGGPKSVRISDLDGDYFLKPNDSVPVHYLEPVNKDITENFIDSRGETNE